MPFAYIRVYVITNRPPHVGLVAMSQAGPKCYWNSLAIESTFQVRWHLREFPVQSVLTYMPYCDERSMKLKSVQIYISGSLPPSSFTVVEPSTYRPRTTPSRFCGSDCWKCPPSH